MPEISLQNQTEKFFEFVEKIKSVFPHPHISVGGKKVQRAVEHLIQEVKRLRKKEVLSEARRCDTLQLRSSQH